MTAAVEPTAVAIALEAAHGAAGIGRVVDAGEHATALRGRRVLVGPIDPCGECDVCRAGGAAVCPRAVRRGAAGPVVVAAARWVVPLDDGLALPSPAGAAVPGDVAIAYTLYARTGLAPRDPVVIVGASPVARFLVDVLRAKAIAPVVVADPARRAWCAWLAAREVAIAPADDAARAVAEVIAARGLGSRPWRVIAVTPDAATAAAALCGPRATLTVYAPPEPAAPALPGALASREVTVIGVAGAHPDLVLEAAALCARGDIDLAAGTTTDGPDDDGLRAAVASV